jgi:hypothetical protein
MTGTKELLIQKNLRLLNEIEQLKSEQAAQIVLHPQSLPRMSLSRQRRSTMSLAIAGLISTGMEDRLKEELLNVQAALQQSCVGRV